jgi:hypothetical protein
MVELQLWQLISLLITFLGGVIAWGKYLLDKTEARIRDIEKRQDEHAAGLARVPSWGDITKIHERMNVSDKKSERMDGEFQSNAALLRSLVNMLLQKGIQ